MRYIDAGKLINDLDKMCREYTQEKSTFHPHIDFVLEVIDAQPTADVRENVKGEWRFIEGDIIGMYDCSNCGHLSFHNSDYCPNCGAQMMRGGDAE